MGRLPDNVVLSGIRCAALCRGSWLAVPDQAAGGAPGGRPSHRGNASRVLNRNGDELSAASSRSSSNPNPRKHPAVPYQYCARTIPSSATTTCSRYFKGAISGSRRACGSHHGLFGRNRKVWRRSSLSEAHCVSTSSSTRRVTAFPAPSRDSRSRTLFIRRPCGTTACQPQLPAGVRSSRSGRTGPMPRVTNQT